MTWKRAVRLAAFVCALVGTGTPLLGQAVQTSALTGTIKDATGAVHPDSECGSRAPWRRLNGANAE